MSTSPTSSPPPVAVIVEAPEVPEQLAMCLASLAAQRFDGFEVLLVDVHEDGRHDSVAAEFQPQFTAGLRHLCAPGAGNLSARALNAAILSTEAEYLVFLRGDCLVQPDGILAHFESAEYGYFLRGEALPLDDAVTVAIDLDVIVSGRAFDPTWLGSVSPRWVRQHLGSGLFGVLRAWFQRDTPTQHYWRNEASSCFRTDAVNVNGFDQSMPTVSLERDFANRLQNYGLEPASAGPTANVLQLFRAGPARPERDIQNVTALGEGWIFRARVGLAELRAESDPAAAGGVAVAQ